MLHLFILPQDTCSCTLGSGEGWNLTSAEEEREGVVALHIYFVHDS